MGEHGLADDVADRKDVRHVGAHLRIHRDEAALADDHARLLGADLPAVGRTARRLQDEVVAHGLRGGLVALELHPQAVVPGLDRHGLRLEHDVVEAVGVLLLPHLDRVGVRALHQAVEHLDHVDARAQRGVDGRHLQPDDAAADHQHLRRHLAQLERAGRVDDAGVARQEGQVHRGRAGGDDAVLELHHLLRAGLVLARAGGLLDFQVVGVEEAAVAADDVDLARLGHAREPAGELADHAVLVLPERVDVHARLGEDDARLVDMLGLLDHRRHMQQRLGGDAAHVQAHAAERRIALDDRGPEPEVGGAEGRRVAAGTGAEHDQVVFGVGAAGVACGRRCSARGWRNTRRPCRSGGSRDGRRRGSRRRVRGCRRSYRGAGAGRGRCRGRRCFDLDQHRAFADLVAQMDQHFLDHAGGRGRHVHRGLVGFERADRIVHRDGVADLHEQLDDRHRIEIADVGDLHFNHLTHLHHLVRSFRKRKARGGEGVAPAPARLTPHHVRASPGGSPPAVARGTR